MAHLRGSRDVSAIIAERAASAALLRGPAIPTQASLVAGFCVGPACPTGEEVVPIDLQMIADFLQQLFSFERFRRIRRRPPFTAQDPAATPEDLPLDPTTVLGNVLNQVLGRQSSQRQRTTFPEGGELPPDIVLPPNCRVVCDGGGDVGFGQFDIGGLLQTGFDIFRGATDFRRAEQERRDAERRARRRAANPFGGGFGGGGASMQLFPDFPGPMQGPTMTGATLDTLGVCPEMYHTTPCGNRLPNKVLQQGQDYWVHAGKPSGWTLVTVKKHRHHHHPPRGRH